MPIEITTVNALLQREFPATDSLLSNGLIDKGGAALISGPQKIGKSLFGTQLALSLAGRVPFLGFPVGTADYRTVILQAEVAPKRMKERFVNQVNGFPREAGGTRPECVCLLLDQAGQSRGKGCGSCLRG